MNISGYAEISWANSGVRIYCTDENMIAWILDELKKFIPSYKIVNQWKLISGEIYQVSLSNFQNKDVDISFWILKQLVLRGWEPFEKGELKYHLRFTGKQGE